MGQNVPVSHNGEAGGAEGEKGLPPALLLLAIGVTLCMVAWGYLVKAAIDFGSTARGGDQDAWMFLGFASLGAVACLFVGLMLVARILRRLGITSSDASSAAAEDDRRAPRSSRPRPVGGHRASATASGRAAGARTSARTRSRRSRRP